MLIPRSGMKIRSSLIAFVLVFLSHHRQGDAINTLRGQPHIIFMIADDMGWNDVGFHGSNQIPTPNIDALCYNGVILNNYYSQPICTPSRSALMTGKYPIKTGLQGYPLSNVEARGLPLAEKILPQYLRELGYSTHLVGKWHLGMAKTSQTPTYRGFDSHFGYRGGFTGYYDYVQQSPFDGTKDVFGFDLYRNQTPAWEEVGKYATDLYTDEAVKVIRNHDNRVPLFLYLSHLAPHAGNEGSLLEAPSRVVRKMGHIVDVNRRKYAAMVSKLDDGIGKVVKALQLNNMLDNSVIIFLSDNGAPSIGVYRNWGSNWPFKGTKETIWEGGVRVPACLWTPNLRGTPRVSYDLMHITDWLPTLLTAAGGFSSSLPFDTDGLDQWLSLVQNVRSPRTEFLYNIDEIERNAAYRRGNWKLVVGQYKGGKYDAHYGHRGDENVRFTPYDFSSVVNSDVSKSLGTVGRTASPSEITFLRNQATVNCPWRNSTTCIAGTGKFCLFNVESDPCEQTDLSATYPHIVRQLKQNLVYYKRSLVNQYPIVKDPRADPVRFNYTFAPWLDNCVVDCQVP